jgi:hypothetical protein
MYNAPEWTPAPAKNVSAKSPARLNLLLADQSYFLQRITLPHRESKRERGKKQQGREKVMGHAYASLVRKKKTGLMY